MRLEPGFRGPLASPNNELQAWKRFEVAFYSRSTDRTEICSRNRLFPIAAKFARARPFIVYLLAANRVDIVRIHIGASYHSVETTIPVSYSKPSICLSTFASTALLTYLYSGEVVLFHVCIKKETPYEYIYQHNRNKQRLGECNAENYTSHLIFSWENRISRSLALKMIDAENIQVTRSM